MSTNRFLSSSANFVDHRRDEDVRPVDPKLLGVDLTSAMIVPDVLGALHAVKYLQVIVK